MLSYQYDTLKRRSDNQYFRNRTNWGIGYYGYYGIDIAINQERNREKYTFTSSRSGFVTNKNEEKRVTELYIRNQLSPKLAVWFKPKQERIVHVDTGNSYTTEAFKVRMEWYLTPNAKLYGDYVTTRYGLESWEPQGYPYDDNFAKISFELTF